MLLVISQVIVLLANSGSINQLPEPVSVNKHAITLDELKAVNDDLTEVRKSLDEINSNSALKDEQDEVNKAESKPVVVPDAPVVLKENKKPQQNITEINSNSDLKNDQVDAKKAVSKPVAAPAVPVVLKKHKENIKPKQKITENKKVELIEKSPVVIIPASVSSDDETVKLIEKPADEVIIAVDIKPAYIKHDINGKSLEDNNEQWTCVSDTKNGLMWEVKSKGDTMRHSENLYSWFDPDNEALQGVTNGGRCKGGTDCDTNAYVNAMNQQKFCGHNDWRLPTREEMMGLVSFGDGANKIKINTSYFPETLPSWYWTASSNQSRPEFAWYILFNNGMPLNDLKENPKHIRLVRSESSS